MTDIAGLVEFLSGCERWLDDEGALQGQPEPRFKQAADALERMESYRNEWFRSHEEANRLAALCHEQQETIAALRAENERWQNLFEHNRKAADEQEAEISRLRAALEGIAGMAENASRHSFLDECGQIARAALGEEGK